MADWFLDGVPVGHVAIGDRGYQYGDGLFETVAIRGGKPRLWQYHVDRLTRGCERLGIRTPAGSDLLDGVIDALRQSKVSDDYSIAKIIVSAGVGTRGYGRARIVAPTVLHGVFAASPPRIESYRDGVDLALCQTRLASESATAGLKTLNRLEQVLARSEFMDSAVFEGLTMDADDHIICGTMSNVFFVGSNRISTPSLRRCGVEGVMRRHIIALLSEQGIETAVRPVNLSDLGDIDEVFVSNSQFGALPVRSCAQWRWAVGETTRHVMSILADDGVRECR